MSGPWTQSTLQSPPLSQPSKQPTCSRTQPRPVNTSVFPSKPSSPCMLTSALGLVLYSRSQVSLVGPALKRSPSWLTLKSWGSSSSHTPITSHRGGQRRTLHSLMGINPFSSHNNPRRLGPLHLHFQTRNTGAQKVSVAAYL